MRQTKRKLSCLHRWLKRDKAGRKRMKIAYETFKQEGARLKKINSYEI